MFDPLEKFKSTHSFLFWETVKPKYPHCEEKPYLFPKIESYTPGLEKTSENLPMSLTPRLWYLSENKNQILQLQHNQLLNNWRKVRDDDSYPHYDEIIDNFEKNLNNFITFVNKQEVGEIKPKQYELTYINHISASNGWEKDSPMENIFPEFKLYSKQKGFLPKCESFNWTNTYLLPNKEGRLYSIIRLVMHKESLEPLIQFQLKVAGVNSEPSLDTMRGWFDLAHKWILSSFVELTNEKVQREYWGRTQ